MYLGKLDNDVQFARALYQRDWGFRNIFDNLEIKGSDEKKKLQIP